MRLCLKLRDRLEASLPARKVLEPATMLKAALRPWTTRVQPFGLKGSSVSVLSESPASSGRACGSHDGFQSALFSVALFNAGRLTVVCLSAFLRQSF